MATARLSVSVAAPDGPVAASRGLAAWLSRIAPARARGEVSLAIVSDTRMQSLNRIYRGKDRATDVLSFAPVPATADRSAVKKKRFSDSRLPSPVSRLETRDSRLLGEIVIAKGVAVRQARDAGHPLGTELRVLALHGLLHLLGYDHEVDDGRMVRVEARLRRLGGLPVGLIERVRADRRSSGSRSRQR